MSEPTIRTDNGKKRRALKHVVVFAFMIIALLMAGEFNVRVPAATWAGPAIVILLFVYGAWILLGLGPMRHL
jgi:hypothetical protein